MFDMLWIEEYQNVDGLSWENMSCPDFALFLMFPEEREKEALAINQSQFPPTTEITLNPSQWLLYIYRASDLIPIFN